MKNYLIKSLLILSVGYSQRSERNEIVYERHPNGLKKLVNIFEGTGKNKVLVGNHGFYENGLKSFIELYRNDRKHGKSKMGTSEMLQFINMCMSYIGKK